MTNLSDILYTAERKISANGIEINYDTFGSPEHPAFLLIQGLGVQMVGWEEGFCRRLAAHGFYVIRFDNRDVGLSTKFEGAKTPSSFRFLAHYVFGTGLDAPYLLKDMAADTVGLMDVLGIEKAHVAGVSMGGMIVQEMAIRYPERLLSLCSIMSSTGDSKLPRPSFRIQQLVLRQISHDPESVAQYAQQLWTALGGSKYPLDKDKIRVDVLARYERSYYPIGKQRQLMAIAASGDRTAALQQTTTPALVIHGSDDPLVSVKAGIATAEAIPEATLEIIEGWGHTLPESIWPQLISLMATHAQAHTPAAYLFEETT